jgi:hypothetical protein
MYVCEHACMLMHTGATLIYDHWAHLVLKYLMDSQSGKMRILKIKCLRCIYINLKAKKSFIEGTEALHNQTEFIGIK